jgi:hypothetical protein
MPNRLENEQKQFFASAKTPNGERGGPSPVPGSKSPNSATDPGERRGPSPTVPGSASPNSATDLGERGGPSPVPGSASPISATDPGDTSPVLFNNVPIPSSLSTSSSSSCDSDKENSGSIARSCGGGGGGCNDGGFEEGDESGDVLSVGISNRRQLMQPKLKLDLKKNYEYKPKRYTNAVIQ